METDAEYSFYNVKKVHLRKFGLEMTWSIKRESSIWT